MAAFDSGEDLVWIDGPTGSGKTLIGEMIRQGLDVGHAAYVCSDKHLQDQFVRDFPYAKVLKGRSNYPTQFMPWPEYTASDCASPDPCDLCDEREACPYQVAKKEASDAGLAVVNTAYFLTEGNYVGRLAGSAGWDLVIVDEADDLERVMMGHVQVKLGNRKITRAGLTAPKKGSHYSTIRSWLLEQMVPALVTEATRMRTTDRAGAKKLLREAKNLEWVAKEVEAGGWVRDEYGEGLLLKPVRVDRYGQEKLWRHGKKWLCMSATLISTDEIEQSLGWTAGSSKITVPMTFDVSNRQINVAPVANMTRKEKDIAWPLMAVSIERVLNRHPGERVLVHTVSYDLAEFLRATVRTDRTKFAYKSSAEKLESLSKFTRCPGGVMFAPSMDRGVDLRDDDCRVVIVAKVPFPNLGDKQVSERMRDGRAGELWYAVQTVRSLVQMTGRAVRNENDWATSYILDRQFVTNVWKKNKHLLPKWWQDALNMKFPTGELR